MVAGAESSHFDDDGMSRRSWEILSYCAMSIILRLFEIRLLLEITWEVTQLPVVLRPLYTLEVGSASSQFQSPYQRLFDYL